MCISKAPAPQQMRLVTGQLSLAAGHGMHSWPDAMLRLFEAFFDDEHTALAGRLQDRLLLCVSLCSGDAHLGRTTCMTLLAACSS